MTDKLVLKSSHEVIYTVDVADVESIFYCKPTDPDILTVLMKDGKRLYCDEVCPIAQGITPNLYAEQIIRAVKHGAQWQKEYMIKEIKIRLVDAATNQDKSTDVVEQTYYNGMVDALGRLRDKFMED